MDADQKKETVVIVHGTWAAPTKGVTKWWQPAAAAGEPPGTFVNDLDAALQCRNSEARCWAHCIKQEDAFRWSGDNDWFRRTQGAVDLTNYLTDLRKLGYRYHLIGHSHGGNVILEALSNFADHRAHLGKVVTIATPFLETQSRILQRRRRNRRVIQFASYAAALALFGSMIFSIGSEPDGLLPLFVLSALTVFWLLIRAWRRRRRSSNEPSPAVGRPAGGLAITSRMDEVWQVLHHLRSTEDPIAVRKNVFIDLWDGIKATYLQRKLVARLHGATELSEVKLPLKLGIGFAYICVLAAPLFAYFALIQVNAMLNIVFEKIKSPERLPAVPGSGELVAFTMLFSIGIVFWMIVATAVVGTHFYSAFLTPARALAHALISLVSVPQTLITRFARSRMWSMLQKFAMGLNGYALAASCRNRAVARLPNTLQDGGIASPCCRARYRAARELGSTKTWRGV